MSKDCIMLSFKSRYQEERDNRPTTFTRKQWRDLLYAFGRPLVPLWDETELYEAVDNFLDEMEM
jgi:hypothetical protein